MANSIEVKVYEVLDPDDGIPVMIPDERDEKEARARMERSCTETITLAGEDPVKKPAALELTRRTREAFDAAWAEYGALRAEANLTTYRLNMPSSKQYWEAESAAKEINEDSGDISTDATKLMSILLPKSVDGMTPTQVEELSPAITTLLWNRLSRAVFPSTERICLFRDHRAGTNPGEAAA